MLLRERQIFGHTLLKLEIWLQQNCMILYPSQPSQPINFCDNFRFSSYMEYSTLKPSAGQCNKTLLTISFEQGQGTKNVSVAWLLQHTWKCWFYSYKIHMHYVFFQYIYTNCQSIKLFFGWILIQFYGHTNYFLMSPIIWFLGDVRMEGV